MGWEAMPPLAPPPLFIPQSWMCSGFGVVAGTSALQNLSMRLVREDVSTYRSVTKAGLSINTAGASGSQILCGLYSMDAEGRPGKRLAVTPALAADVTGWVEVSFTAPVTLVPGSYYKAIVSNSTSSFAVNAVASGHMGRMVVSGAVSTVSSIGRVLSSFALPLDESASVFTAAAGNTSQMILLQ